MKKKLVAFLMAVCMAVPSFGTVGATVEAADKEEAKVIDVTKYGADPTGATDSTPAIKKAIEAAKKVTKKSDTPVAIDFPEGRYDIYPDQAEERELYISNTVGTNQTYKDKKIGILIEDMDNVTVEGNDSLFMFHGKMTTFASIDSENVTFQNFEVDFQVPTVIDMTAVKKEGNEVTYYIPECYNYQVNGNSIKWMSDKSPYTGETYWTTTNSMKYTQIFDTKNGMTWRGGSPFANISKIEDLENHHVKITYTNADSIQEGYCFQMRNTERDHAGTFFWQSKDVTLNDLDIRFIHGFGMVGQFSENITMKDVDFETDKASGRTTAGYADFIQMSGCKGLIDISDCTFSNPHDDPINIHGTFLQVIGISDDRTEVTVQYKHNETAGFPNYYVGDQVEFSTRGNMVPVSEDGKVAVREVVKVDGPDGKGGKGSLNDLTKIKLTFDKPIPAEITANNSHVVENITYTPEVKIHDNIFKETPTRGVLCTTRGKVEITDNMFDNMGMAAIYISNDAQGWYESGRTTDVTIKGNTFIVNPLTAGAAGIFVQPTNGNVNGIVHKNMKIEDNTFFMAQSQNVLNAKCVENLTFKNNKVYRQNPDVTVSAKADKTNLAAGESSSITVTADGAELGAKAYRFEGCKNVTIEGNTYDGGLNAGVELASTDKNQVTVKNDVAKVGADNKLNKVGTIFYKSSNDKVVKVSASGVVTAVGNGTADVTAYAVAGGRKFEAAPITYTVEGETTVQPTAIKITTNQEKLTDQTLQYTAEVTAEDEADKAVTWSVVDPTTGQATDKATINETSGLLTAEKSGAVEVVAKTKNGLEARKLLSIQVGEVALAEEITIEGEDTSRWSIPETNKIHVQAAQGGTFNNQTPANWFKVPVDKTVKEVTIKIEGKTKSSWEDVGLYLGKDADNYVAIQRKHRGGTEENLGMVNEMNGDANNGREQLKKVEDQDVEEMYFKLSREGNNVTSYYKVEGKDWTKLGEAVENTTFIPSDNGQLYVAFGAMMDQGADGNTSYTFSELTVDGERVPLTKDSAQELAKGITIQGENKERWDVEGENRIHVKSTSGGVFNRQTPANWFKVPVDNNTTEVSLKIEGKTAVEWEDVGLYLGKDADNYVAIQRKHRQSNVGERFGMVSESNQSASEQLAESASDKQDVKDLYFRLLRSDNKVTSYYSEDGKDWTKFGNEVTNTTFMPDSNGQLYVAFGAMGNGNTGYVFTDLKVNNKPVALTQSVSDNLPSVSEVSVAYTEAENKLTASYKLGEGSDKIVKWAVSSEENGFYSVLEANTGDTLTATPDMKNKYVKAVVVPVKDSGVSGDIVWSSQAVKVTGEGLDAGNAKSANARLAKADITGLTKGFEFDKNTLTYLTMATTEEKELNVEFAAEDKNAKVETVFNDKVVQGNKGKLTLTSGRNLIEVTVTAEDGITKKYYRFTIFRDGDDNAKLTSLKVDGQTVELKDDVYEYRVDVNKAKEVALEVVANASAKVAMSFEGKVVKDNKVTLQPGSNMVNIIVTPETSAEPTRYAVNIKVPDPTNANLESVVFSDNVKLDKKFEKTTTEYTGIATSSAITIDVAAEEKDATVKVTVNGKEQKELKKVKLVEGDNTIVIEVISPDKKEKKTYTFELEGKSVIYLSDLEHKNNSTNGWSNKPFGMDKTYEGNPIRLVEDEEQNIRTFEKGVWSHATANIYYDLENKGYKEFETYVGVDAAQLGKPGSVTFKVFIDEQEVFTSTKEMAPEDIMQHVKVTIPEGAKELHLQALMGASDSNDHADWADAKFVTAFDGGEEPSVPVESVAVTADKKELKVGETAQATAIVTPDNATNKEVTWSVSDKEVISVDNTGKVTAKAKGTAEVIATAANGVSGKVTIEVTEKDIPVEPDKADKSDLQELVDKYSELKEKDYTADSWKGYQEAMDTAKKVLADEDATQEEVDAASTVLKNAVDKLVKVDEQKKPEQKPSDSNKDKNQEKPVKTGDTMTVLPVAVLMAACVAVVAVFVRKRREGRS
ncbi:MAG: NPCBM/NEW2 domain-containing protein [Coprococcus sp.]